MNIPNIITLFRILLVPVTVWLLISDAWGWAFATFLLAGASDGVDGYLARRWKLQTRLGAYLDPLADKALMASVYVTLGFLKVLPAWLVIAVVSRDVLIVAAVLIARLSDNPIKVAPIMVSKLNTVVQVVFVVAVLGVMALGWPQDHVVGYGSIPVVLLTALSGLAYLMAWMRHMAEAEEGPKP